MLSRVLPVVSLVASIWLVVAASPLAEPESATVYTPMLKALEPAEACLMPPPPAYAQQGAVRPSEDWPGRDTLGGNVSPLRLVYDPHPTYNGLAVDSKNGVVVMTDENRHGLMLYDRTSGGGGPEVTEPRRHVFGPRAGLGFMAGVTLDPVNREIYATSNDGGGLTVFSYDSHGNVEPRRRLRPPHQSWGLSLSLARNELAITSQQNHGLYVFDKNATGADMPLRIVKGTTTRIADPHGVILDDVNGEIFVANHGNWTELRSYAADGPLVMDRSYVAGKFYPPSITVFDADANGNVAPLRVIEGPTTRLNWPMGMAIDHERQEILVANYGTSSVLVFDRKAAGDVAPIREIGGPRSGVVGPVGIGVDVEHGEVWVANYGDHTAVVLDRSATGDVAPLRIIRNAPKGTPTTGFTNASAGAYDSKRGQVLVPN